MSSESNFQNMSASERWEESSINRPIPGEALTVRPGMYPYERPAQHNDAEEAFDAILNKVLVPRNFNAIVATLDAGFPLDTFVNAYIRYLFQEGVIDPRLIPIVAVPLTVMFMRMCEATKVDFVLSTDGNQRGDISEAEIMARFYKEQQKAANGKNKAEKAMTDVKRMFKREGLMARPEAMG